MKSMNQDFNAHEAYLKIMEDLQDWKIEITEKIILFCEDRAVPSGGTWTRPTKQRILSLREDTAFQCTAGETVSPVFS
jgi:hypothetical protein